MNEKETNENLAAAMGMSADDLGLDDGNAPVTEIIGDDEDEESTPSAEEKMEFEDGGDADPEEEHSDADDTAEEQGTTMPYAEATAIKAALAGDGLPQDLIEALSEDQLRSYMAKRADRDAAFERLRSKLNAKPIAETSSAEKAEGEGAPKEPDNPLPEADLTALAEDFGEEEAKRIASYVSSQVQSATGPLMAAIEHMIDSQQQSRLSGVVPGGLDGEKYEAVRGRAIQLGNAGTYAELTGTQRQDALFDAALRLEFPDIPTAAETESEERRAAQKRNGSPSRTGRAARKVKTLSKDDAMHARAMAAIEGTPLEEIQRMYPG